MKRSLRRLELVKRLWLASVTRGAAEHYRHIGGTWLDWSYAPQVHVSIGESS